MKKGIPQHSYLFSTLYHEDSAKARIGRGSHYSIIRATVLAGKKATFHDLAIIWDEDHDERVIWVIEQMIVRGLLHDVIAVGERKGHISVVTRNEPRSGLIAEIEDISQNPPSDVFSSDVSTAGKSSIIQGPDKERSRAYLLGIDALWVLGSKECYYTTAPYGNPPI